MKWFRRLTSFVRKTDPRVLFAVMDVVQRRGASRKLSVLSALNLLVEVAEEINKARGLTPHAKQVIAEIAAKPEVSDICCAALEAKNVFRPAMRQVETDEDLVVMALSDPDFRAAVKKEAATVKKEVKRDSTR